MEIPISEFRKRVFEAANQALEGAEVWVTHKGRRLRFVAEQAPDKLSRITPLDFLVPGADLEDDSWKQEIQREWERNWDRELNLIATALRKEPGAVRARSTRVRRPA